MGNVGFFEKYSCTSFFGKLSNKCFIFSDVRKMATEYEENLEQIVLENEKNVKKIKEDSKKNIDEIKNVVEELQTNIKDMTELHNRTNATKEKIINDLNDKIDELKRELREKDKAHEAYINNILIENSSKLNRIKTECADALLKADKKNNKVAKCKMEEVVEETKPEAIPELPTLEEAGINTKKQKARTGTRAFSLEQIKKIKERRANGEQVIAIAKDLGVHKSTINRALKK